MPWLPAAAGAASILGTAVSLARGGPEKPGSGSILDQIRATADLPALPGIQRSPSISQLQLPNLDLGNFGSNKPSTSMNFGGNLNNNLLKTLGSMGV